MEAIRQTIDMDPEVVLTLKHVHGSDLKDVCIFDIETTGLSPKISNVYLIGAIRFRDDTCELTQWFADDYTSEATLLSAFSDYLSDGDTIIHYNGTTFDIPYLEKKYIEHELVVPFLQTESLDLYREVRPFKGIFATSDQKLSSMERLVGYDRGIDHDGRECIDLYTRFMQEKYAHNDSASSYIKEQILKHNFDDLIGTAMCSKLLLYTRPVITDVSVEMVGADGVKVWINEPGTDRTDCPEEPAILEKTLIMKSSLPQEITYPFKLKYEACEARVICDDKEITVIIPIINDTKYFYFSDYKNYFYLPDEDMAVHKSVGSFVDKDHRKPATAATCYTKKVGSFIPLAGSLDASDLPVFYDKDSRRSAGYLEITDVSKVPARALMMSYLKR